jgi:DNA recombination protein RmuC
MMEVLLLATLLLVLMAVALAAGVRSRLARVLDRLEAMAKDEDKLERAVREEAVQSRAEAGLQARQGREELSGSLRQFSDFLLSRMTEIATLQKEQLDIFARQLATLTQSNEQKLEKLREALEQQLKELREDNSQKLEQMRATVDEKLHDTLEKRLGESFQLVSERLELVHKGLGEMQSLASGVGDLKKVLTNVKTRGTWGEVQLGNLLEQVLVKGEQYEENVATKAGSGERVEFAIRLPGRDREDAVVWLPIDAKFPQEDYQRLLEAQDQGNQTLVEAEARQLEVRLKAEAKNIREKYLDPPHTTDFGLLFVPTEGLYAEILRRPGLWDSLQRECRVTVVGPSNLLAFLNSLQMGFRTLAIERRSSEVWALLGAVKTEFGKFGDLLDKTQKKLQEASHTIEDAARKSRTIERKLKDVQELPAGEAAVAMLTEADGG